MTCIWVNLNSNISHSKIRFIKNIQLANIFKDGFLVSWSTLKTQAWPLQIDCPHCRLLQWHPPPFEIFSWKTGELFIYEVGLHFSKMVVSIFYFQMLGLFNTLLLVTCVWGGVYGQVLSDARGVWSSEHEPPDMDAWNWPQVLWKNIIYS